MNWSSADTLSAEVPLRGSETILPTIEVPGVGQATLAPMCLPYSPEYQPPVPGRGSAALERLAKSTSGGERLNLAGVWKDIPRKPRLIPLASYLLLAAVMLFLLEVFERRTGLLSVGWRRAAFSPREGSASRPKAAVSVTPRHAAERVPAPGTTKAATMSVSPPLPADAVGNESITDLLGQAQRRAQQRTKRT
jgi:hypothetical protein